jgi:hypothetical protein
MGISKAIGPGRRIAASFAAGRLAPPATAMRCDVVPTIALALYPSAGARNQMPDGPGKNPGPSGLP